MKRFDCLVLGAGPAGSAAAKAIVQAGRSVALIDRATVPRRKVGEALPAAARPLLSKLGFLETVEGGPHEECPGNISSWGNDGLEATDFLRNPHGMGWHLDRPAFDHDLRVAAVAAGAEDVRGFARDLKKGEIDWTARVGGVELTAPWVVDATGRAARVARRNGCERIVDGDLCALVAYLKPLKGDALSDQRTLIEAVEGGWWYSARLPKGLRVVVFHTGRLAAQRLLGHGRMQELLAESRHLSTAAKGCWLGVPRLVEASGSALQLPFGNGWLAAGDAAMAFDPLSSQGIFNALYSGLRAGEAVSALLDDDIKVAVAYAKRLAEIRQVYLSRRTLYYAAEGRWPTSAFWANQRPPAAIPRSWPA